MSIFNRLRYAPLNLTSILLALLITIIHYLIVRMHLLIDSYRLWTLPSLLSIVVLRSSRSWYRCRNTYTVLDVEAGMFELFRKISQVLLLTVDIVHRGEDTLEVESGISWVWEAKPLI